MVISLTRGSIIEECFSRYLEHQVQVYPGAIHLRYTTVGSASKHQVFRSPHALEATGTTEFQVLTPLFYSSLIASRSPLEYLQSELTTNDPLKRTFWTSDATALLAVFAVADPAQHRPTAPISVKDEWAFLEKFRSHPLTPLDIFAMTKLSPLPSRRYLSVNLDLALGRWLPFLGIYLVDIGDWIMRLPHCCLGVLLTRTGSAEDEIIGLWWWACLVGGVVMHSWYITRSERLCTG